MIFYVLKILIYRISCRRRKGKSDIASAVKGSSGKAPNKSPPDPRNYFIVVTANPGRIKTLFIREGRLYTEPPVPRLRRPATPRPELRAGLCKFHFPVIHSPRLVSIDGRKLESRESRGFRRTARPVGSPPTLRTHRPSIHVCRLNSEAVRESETVAEEF